MILWLPPIRLWRMIPWCSWSSIRGSVPTVQPLVQVTQFITCGIRLPWASISSPVFAAGSKCLCKVTFLEENKVVFRAWRTQLSTPRKSWWMWQKSLMFQLLSSFSYHSSIIEVPWRAEVRTSNHFYETLMLNGPNALQCWMLDAGTWFTSTSGIEDLCAHAIRSGKKNHAAADLMRIQSGPKTKQLPCIYIHHGLLDLCNRFYHQNLWGASNRVLLQNEASFTSSVQGDQFVAKWRILNDTLNSCRAKTSQRQRCLPLRERGVDLVNLLGLQKKAAQNGNEWSERASHDVYDMFHVAM